MNFEIGKKYHNPISSEYILIHNVFSFEGKDYITYSLHNKSTDSRFGFYTNFPDSHKKKIPYVKTHEVTHERWVVWFSRTGRDICSCIRASEYDKEYWERMYSLKFLKCEKITYTEIVNEE